MVSVDLHVKMQAACRLCYACNLSSAGREAEELRFSSCSFGYAHTGGMPNLEQVVVWVVSQAQQSSIAVQHLRFEPRF